MFVKGRRYGSGGMLKRMLIKWNLIRCAKKADVILADSEFTKKELTGLIRGIEKKVKVLYPGLSAEWLTPVDNDSAESARIKYASGKKFFLYVGNYKPHKNVDLLVNAFADFSSRGEAGDRILVLAGGDPENCRRVTSLIHRRKAENIVRSFGNVSESDLKALYCSADWLITASEYEGFGYPLLEAMALKCPVICSPCSSIPEVVGESACFINNLSIDGIISALSSAVSMTPDRRDKIVRDGFERAEKIIRSSNDSGKRLLDIIRVAAD